MPPHKKTQTVQGPAPEFIDEYPDYFRADKDVICPACGEIYQDHPLDGIHKDWTGAPWLRILCDGRRVKL